MRIFQSIKWLSAVTFAVFAVTACKEHQSSTATPAASPVQNFVVYKTPTCECCSRWVDHMAAAGFELGVEEMKDLSGIKGMFDLKPPQQSCHTAVWQEGKTRYVFEGHVPAQLIRKFLQEKPENALGLLVPGMPVGSPGMEYGDKHMPYDVLLLKKDGSTMVYAHIDESSQVAPSASP